MKKIFLFIIFIGVTKLIFSQSNTLFCNCDTLKVFVKSEQNNNIKFILKDSCKLYEKTNETLRTFNGIDLLDSLQNIVVLLYENDYLKYRFEISQIHCLTGKYKEYHKNGIVKVEGNYAQNCKGRIGVWEYNNKKGKKIKEEEYIYEENSEFTELKNSNKYPYKLLKKYVKNYNKGRFYLFFF